MIVKKFSEYKITIFAILSLSFILLTNQYYGEFNINNSGASGKN